MDVKTILRSDCISQIGKDYPGVLKRDSEDHYTFIETIPSTNGKRNPHVFKGQYITVTRNDDGSLRLNFKPIRVNDSPKLQAHQGERIVQRGAICRRRERRNHPGT